WGGWYVTGRTVPAVHRGNTATLKTEESGFPLKGVGGPLASLAGHLDLAGFPTPYSDVVALMVLEHQTHAINLITRLGWEARAAAFARTAPQPARPSAEQPSARVAGAVNALVDYLLFVDEAPFQGKLEGSSGFAERFAAEGPRDRRGRS